MSRKLRKPVKIAAGITAVCITAVILTFSTIVPNAEYNRATELMDSDKYTEAAVLFEKLGSFKDSKELAEQCRQGTIYITAVNDMNSGEYEKAVAAFDSITDFRDSSSLKNYCELMLEETKADELISQGKLTEALAILEKLQGEQSNVDSKLNELAIRFYENDDFENALRALDLMTEQTESGNEIRQSIDENNETIQNEKRYEELTAMSIVDEESVETAKDLIDQLPSDYEDVAEYAELIDLYGDYIGYYHGSGDLGDASIRIEDKTVYLQTAMETVVLEQGNLSAMSYIDDSNNSIYTVNDSNTITVIMIRDGNVIYESFVR